VKIDKVLELDELVEIISKAKSTNKTVVHCHGVFDLIHVGHIRHFEEAKKLGDMLIVTITPDKYVNKGPHRPAFTEKLRAEVIASVDCVNYVAINNWPTAVKTIEFLRPNIYAKGIEYNDAEKDYSKGIVSEEKAIKKVGGELKFTDNITFSSSNLINKYLDVLSRDVKEYLTKFSKTTTSEDLIGYLERIKNIKILVIGEAIIDEYQFGQSIGKAAKESIIALKYLKTEKFAGGTLAIGNHLSNFCDNVHLFTLLGDIDSQEDFISKNLSKKVKTLFHYKKDSPTIVKRRFIEEFPLRKLLEFYIFNDMEVDKEQTLEMKKHLLSLGSTSIHILDDCFNVNKDRVIEICEEINKRKLKFNWSARGRVTIDDETARALVESGCNKLHVGVESLDPDVLRWMNKGIKVETTENFFEICKKNGIETLAYFILGSPMETREYRENLAEMIQKMGVTYPYFNILYPAANTKYYQMLREDGTFERDYWQDFAENPTPNFEMPLPRTPELQAELQQTVHKYLEIVYGTS